MRSFALALAACCSFAGACLWPVVCCGLWPCAAQQPNSLLLVASLLRGIAAESSLPIRTSSYFRLLLAASHHLLLYAQHGKGGGAGLGSLVPPSVSACVDLAGKVEAAAARDGDGVEGAAVRITRPSPAPPPPPRRHTARAGKKKKLFLFRSPHHVALSVLRCG